MKLVVTTNDDVTRRGGKPFLSISETNAKANLAVLHSFSRA